MSLTVKFKGDSSSFDKALNRVKSGVKSVATPITAAAKGVAVLGAAFTAAAAAAVAFTYKMVKIGEEANTSNNRLRNIVKQMGLFGGEADKVSGRLEKFAEAQARATGIDDKSIKQAQAFLSTFSEIAQTADVAGGSFDRATKAALDLSAAGFQSVEQAAIALGKALQDPLRGISALGKAGVTFSQQEKEKLAALVESNKMLEVQDIILQAIETQVTKTATATANATDKLAVMRQQLLNAFAKPVADVFGNLTGEVGKGFEKVQAKFAEAGSMFANAIQQAVRGDASRFLAIGKMIGDLLADGMKIAFDASIWSMELAARKLALRLAEQDPMIGPDSAIANKLREAVGVAEQMRASKVETGFKEAVENLNKNIEAMRRQIMADSVYNAGFRGGGGERIQEFDRIEHIFNEYLDEQKKTNAYLEEEKQDRKGL